MKESKKIKCLAYFDAQDSSDDRMNCLAAFTKSSYIFDCFEKLGYDVDILSASYAIGSHGAKGKVCKLSDKITLRTLSSIGRGNKIKNIIGRIFFALNLIFHLLFFVRKNDVLWVYHSLGLIRYVKFLKKIKKFKLILEVEEIYGDVMERKKVSDWELDFFKCADVYVFSNKQLANLINTHRKPCVVAHGSYKAEEPINKSCDDGRIHIVYAGTFDPRKGGMTAAKTAEFLGDNYHVHILGFGNKKDTQALLSEIEDVSKKSTCKLTYHGCLTGKEYISFLQSCHIGLCTQAVDGAYNNTSFPSKVLVYMANGLRVLSVRIPAIEQSDVGGCMYYYDDPSPESVAKAIKSIDFADGYDGRKIISELDEKFIQRLGLLIKGLE